MIIAICPKNKLDYWCSGGYIFVFCATFNIVNLCHYRILYFLLKNPGPRSGARNHKGAHAMFTAILAWLGSKKTFLKVQSGTGDNLLKEDIREGFVDYCLWSTFRPDCIDIDGELDMACLDSGMFLFRDYPDAMTALRACYTQAFDDAYDESDVTVLLEE